MNRRQFIKSGSAALASYLLFKKSYADELITNDKILTLFGDAYNILVKERGNKFEYEEKIDVNGDNRPDKVLFKLTPGEFVTKPDNSGIVEGPRFEMQIDLGDNWTRKIYGIMGGNGKAIICKSRDLGTDGLDAERYLSGWLQQQK